MSLHPADGRLDTMVELLRRHLVADAAPSDLVVTPGVEATNGYSNRTEMASAHGTSNGVDVHEGFVMRSHFPDKDLFFDTHLFHQWHVMQAVAQHTDIPLPPLVMSDDSDPENPFFVMREVAGRVPTTVPSYHHEGWVTDLQPAQQRQLAINGLTILADLHRIDWRQGFEFLDHPHRGRPGLDQYLTYVDEWLVWTAKGRSMPVLEAAVRYMHEHRPDPTDVVVTWGDARVGNIIFADDLSVAAVLDWEMAALGPPEMDLGWWLMFEALQKGGGPGLPGIPDRDETIQLYESLSGRTVGDVRYYEILAWLRIAITCTRMFCAGPDDDLLPARDMTAVIAEYLGMTMD
ncbi:MAG: putative phosphotransferase [Ilumatobacteraceae bacterium]|nr:putative phosphotransferase [Ilumatobacteraceae bacterium]